MKTFFYLHASAGGVFVHHSIMLSVGLGDSRITDYTAFAVTVVLRLYQLVPGTVSFCFHVVMYDAPPRKTPRR